MITSMVKLFTRIPPKFALLFSVRKGKVCGYCTYKSKTGLVAQKGTNPILSVLEGWGKDMEKMQSEGSTAAVSFKFRLRQDNDETAFESGLFRYVLTDAKGTEQVSVYVFETRLVKKEGQWKILMERQIREVDQADWSAQP